MLLATASANLDWNTWLGVLRPSGTVCMVSASPGAVSLPALPMILRQLTFCGSVVGSPHQIAEMLSFSALHNVRPTVEIVSMHDVNLALDKVRNNRARYRMVLAR